MRVDLVGRGWGRIREAVDAQLASRRGPNRWIGRDLRLRRVLPKPPALKERACHRGFHHGMIFRLRMPPRGLMRSDVVRYDSVESSLDGNDLLQSQAGVPTSSDSANY